MSDFQFVWALIMGVLIGWGAHSIVLQIAYRRGIVKYIGAKP